MAYFVLWPINSLGRRFVSTLVDLHHQRDALGRTILQLEDSYQIGLRPADTLRAASKIVRGDYGDDLRWGLMPRLAAVGDLKDLPATPRLDVVRDEVFGGWAREVLSSFRIETDLPISILLELNNRLDAIKDPEPEPS